jgi:hypothetical protein
LNLIEATFLIAENLQNPRFRLVRECEAFRFAGGSAVELPHDLLFYFEEQELRGSLLPATVERVSRRERE